MQIENLVLVSSLTAELRRVTNYCLPIGETPNIETYNQDRSKNPHQVHVEGAIEVTSCEKVLFIALGEDSECMVITLYNDFNTGELTSIEAIHTQRDSVTRGDEAFVHARRMLCIMQGLPNGSVVNLL